MPVPQNIPSCAGAQADGTLILPLQNLVEGVLLRRYKRFLADVELPDGQVVTAHCPNTGPMTGVLHPGGRVRLRHDPRPERKLAWTWEQAMVADRDGSPCWVGVNTALPNRLVRATIEAGCLEPWLGPIGSIRAEVAYGQGRRSRIDLLLSPAAEASDPRPIYLEVKNTTWSRGDLALFPDTVTERGQKHLRELMAVGPEARGLLVPCLSRADVTRFAPGDSADPRYGELFRQALAAGVEVLPLRYRFSAEAVTWIGVAELVPQEL
ncbi:DNA/RNA nuclease SfsA [Synechococcus sp. CS-205]|uniref:DNA/RNA nuclease SfsA n=1 Tax=Synechococcus sp. CS-205 TaxID=2847984 RepID=UPI00223AEC11|nr:DNA/RNA nuclease SfsA [Synechococcus sp. CS-205]MCT0249190.1 DNA/RNA nuclease SfsA [Synechococcus sp. CS-205]